MDNSTRQIISILVNNQPGVLSRIAGLFSRRGYNIDGLTVCATEDDSWSRMTITVNATPATVKQIVAQLEKQEDVVKVMDFDPVKVAAGGAKRSEIADLIALFGAKAIDVTAESMMLELTGSTDKVDNFVRILGEYGILEMARTGGAALERGAGSLAGSKKSED